MNNSAQIIDAVPTLSRKAQSKEFLDKLKSFLEKLYVLDSAKELDESEKTDIIIIVGKNKQE